MNASDLSHYSELEFKQKYKFEENDDIDAILLNKNKLFCLKISHKFYFFNLDGKTKNSEWNLVDY